MCYSHIIHNGEIPFFPAAAEVEPHPLIGIDGVFAAVEFLLFSKLSFIKAGRAAAAGSVFTSARVPTMTWEAALLFPLTILGVIPLTFPTYLANSFAARMVDSGAFSPMVMTVAFVTSKAERVPAANPARRIAPNNVFFHHTFPFLWIKKSLHFI